MLFRCFTLPRGADIHNIRFFFNFRKKITGRPKPTRSQTYLWPCSRQLYLNKWLFLARTENFFLLTVNYFGRDFHFLPFLGRFFRNFLVWEPKIKNDLG